MCIAGRGCLKTYVCCHMPLEFKFKVSKDISLKVKCIEVFYVLYISTMFFNISAIPEDAVREESDDDDKANPDERLTQAALDKRIVPDNEFSDSEDEGEGGRRDQRSFKGRKRPRLDTKASGDGHDEKLKGEGDGAKTENKSK